MTEVRWTPPEDDDVPTSDPPPLYGVQTKDDVRKPTRKPAKHKSDKPATATAKVRQGQTCSDEPSKQLPASAYKKPSVAQADSSEDNLVKVCVIMLPATLGYVMISGHFGVHYDFRPLGYIMISGHFVVHMISGHFGVHYDGIETHMCVAFQNSGPTMLV